MRWAIVVLVGVLGGCSTIEQGPTILSWEGTAMGRSYRGTCAQALFVGGSRVEGAWTWPNTIWLARRACLGDQYTLEVLAHEVAHLVECGPDEQCAEVVSASWLESGITLKDLGWEN